MDKMKMHSLNFTDENIAKLAELFPSCITESKNDDGLTTRAIDFDQLKQELSKSIVDGPQERYQLNWPGKREALLTANTPITKTLRPCRKESVDFDSTGNLFIEGDNLDALKLLQETYLGKVKMIYIDPPYNTGRNLLYKNDYRENSVEYLGRSGQQTKDGDKLVSNPESSGRFHSDWLTMMYQRLKASIRLLAEDGVLVCAIDENEFGTLSVLLKELFSGAAWEHAYITVIHNPRGQQGRNFSYINEYLIFIYKSGTKAIGDRRISPNEVDWSQFRNWGGESERSDAKNCFYPIIIRDGEILGFGEVSADDYHPSQTMFNQDDAYVYPIDNKGIERKWRYARQSVEKIKTMLRARKTDQGYQIEIGKTFGLHKSVWTDKRYDSNEYGSKLVNKLVEGSGFTFPKSLWAVYDPIEAVTLNDSDAIVLDFFAGSGTTAHAVMQLNASDGGKRKFIAVQIPEPIDESTESFKAGFKSIADITKERIRKAGNEIKQANNLLNLDLDVGFRVLKVSSSNMSDVYYSPDSLNQNDLFLSSNNIKEDRSAEDLLFQVLLDWGVDLSLPINKETIAGREVLFVDGNALVACFDKEGRVDEDFCKELAARAPLRVVFRDAGFKDDSVKINIDQIFKLLSPHSDLKSI
ncbi:site-specific DNA-methyltransferase [Gammaproteobacteria bacterium]|nr:site-specific DNA-methyltransferase [Gammaproteobacteria bacterium]